MTNTSTQTLESLFATINSRKGTDPSSSHTAKLFKKGLKKIAQKMGEEAVETIIASLAEEREDVISESADLLYHLLVLWAACDVTPEEVMNELDKRRGISGIEEKKSRKKG